MSLSWLHFRSVMKTVMEFDIMSLDGALMALGKSTDEYMWMRSTDKDIYDDIYLSELNSAERVARDNELEK